MIFFITALRALASCLITNAHYTGIYPADIIANGGLIGDIIFFAVSGYCLYNVKNDLTVRGFFSWYGKRLWRVYPPVIICTAIYGILGAYHVTASELGWWFVYPTYYHFVGSIVVLYIPFFFVAKVKVFRDNLVKVMVAVAIVELLVYCFFYNKSYYHIDTVREPMIRFLFLESMLLGAWFKRNDSKLRNNNKPIFFVALVICAALYFISKLVFSRIEMLSTYQIINQVIIFFLLFFVFRTFCGADQRLEKIPKKIRGCIEFVSKITIEIYVVQYVLIDCIKATPHN